ncbi:TPA: hypothetical protein ACH3X2_003074 [Trebouxia sp. C0005]
MAEQLRGKAGVSAKFSEGQPQDKGEWRGYRIARVPFHHSSHEFPLCLPSPADSPEPGPPYIPPQFLRQYHRNSPIIPLEDR